MHMADALLSPAVGLTAAAVSAAAIGIGCYRLRKQKNFEGKLPVLAMAGAFVFAAQMINFAIPGTGSSGHIGGGLLLAAILGPWQALITIAVVLLIQCLFFADGGLLALGCNVLNMGIIPCLAVYPLLRRFIQNHPVAGSLCGALAALPLGALAVVLETTLSGITQLPTLQFAQLMIPIHFAIALGEGIATAAVVLFLANTRPELLDLKITAAPKFNLSKKALAAVAVSAILLTGLGLSAFASAKPDGLEWAIENTASQELAADGSIYQNAERIQNTTSIFPDYEIQNVQWSSTWLAALLGILMVAFMASLIYAVLTKRQNAKV